MVYGSSFAGGVGCVYERCMGLDEEVGGCWFGVIVTVTGMKSH